MIDPQPLAIIREIDRTGSLTLAAEKLNMTQSAASHAIRRFEDRYGVAILEKEGRGLRLTYAGTYLLGVANRVLPQLIHAENVLEEFAKGRRGTLRIGMECHPCQQWLMRVVTPYLKTWPQVDLEVSTAFRFGGLAALLGHEIDILITPDPINRPGLIYYPAFDYELVLAVPEGHPLARRKHALPEDLDREILITYPVAPERLDIFTQFLVPAGRIPRQHRTAETSDLMLQMVATGRGVSAIPDWLIQEAPAQQKLHAVKIGRSGIHKSIHIGLRLPDSETEHVQGFLELAGARVPTTHPAEKPAK